ncbi:LptB superfamily ABC transporter ATP-binding protein [Candidatus Trichorickettsia mobilis]|uniref:Lipopolysaccharide export system ATP-binding protein LptB n=1 Tax=Candidatus Trichorickettsia mobilis TaxID=1346319 RepID=A0ABZ0UW20_9RICK|nr:LPS export ABC transporter ATP-binding protein [Candidatus Trichorickettsia mobilis]WPY00239.1 LptB superfamily ABC transporter ATP-binding protein [Candidatus Trichorickettsia mobilis]
MTATVNSLRIENISKSFIKRPILRGVSLQITLGEVVGLFGPNGAGKTTCFSIIAGLVKADSGKLFFDNHDITHLPMYLRAQMGLGYLPQEPSIFRGLSVFDNLRAVIEITERDKEIVEQKAEDLLAEFSISHLKNSPSISLSGGERRRLEIARALASNPKFVMLDEPLAGIDPLAIIDIKHLVKYLKKRNIGILITDHNVRETLDIVDRAYIIYDGKVLMEGDPTEIVNSDKVREVYLGHSYTR